MIYTDVTGRCGNQLFQYAFARKLSMLHGDMPMHFSFYNVERWRQKTGEESFSDQLRYFQVKPYTSDIVHSDWIQSLGSQRQKRCFRQRLLYMRISKRLHNKWIAQRGQAILNRAGIYREDKTKIKLQKSKEKDIFAKGYFEDPRFFADIRPQLLEEFTPKAPPKEKNRELYDTILNKESVCVSFRKWGEVSEEIRAQRDVCGKEYYQKAIQRMHEMKPDAVFVVFSDDVQWVKENFCFPCDVVYEDGTDEIWEKLRMMYSCKHFITTTSTFAWWAQYLCRNPDKIVIAPDRWYNGTGMESHLLMDDWIKISADL